MKTRAKTAIAVVGGASMLALGVLLAGGSQALSVTTKPVATPTSSVAAAPSPAVAPEDTATVSPTSQFESPGGGEPPSGCIPHMNC
jgi:hypothetical protein